METKILFAAAIFFGGWLWFYLFVRQFLIQSDHGIPDDSQDAGY